MHESLWFLDDTTAVAWLYLIIFAVSALDAVFPLVPSEATVITAGVLAAHGRLHIALVVLAAACGAFSGDASAYAIGRFLGPWVRRRTSKTEKSRKRWEGAERGLERRGVMLIFGARFIPGGRTAVTVTAGLVRFPWHRFAAAIGGAALAWATYAGLIGYFGGRAFEDNTLLALATGFGIAFTVFAAVEVGRRLRHRSA